MSMNEIETLYGLIESTADALRVFQLCREGKLGRVRRRLHEKERRLIRSGSVFVFSEQESGIKRWTDGRAWSPSRIFGNFLIYREVLSRCRKSSDDLSIDGNSIELNEQSLQEDQSLDDTNNPEYLNMDSSSIIPVLSPYKNSLSMPIISYDNNETISYVPAPTATPAYNMGRPIGAENEDLTDWIKDRLLLLDNKFKSYITSKVDEDKIHEQAHSQQYRGTFNIKGSHSLRGGGKKYNSRSHQRPLHYNFKMDGLIKKTISIQMDGSNYHLICYYSRDDFTLGSKNNKFPAYMMNELNKVAIPSDLIVFQQQSGLSNGSINGSRRNSLTNNSQNHSFNMLDDTDRSDIYDYLDSDEEWDDQSGSRLKRRYSVPLEGNFQNSSSTTSAMASSSSSGPATPKKPSYFYQIQQPTDFVGNYETPMNSPQPFQNNISGLTSSSALYTNLPGIGPYYPIIIPAMSPSKTSIPMLSHSSTNAISGPIFLPTYLNQMADENENCLEINQSGSYLNERIHGQAIQSSFMNEQSNSQNSESQIAPRYISKYRRSKKSYRKKAGFARESSSPSGSKYTVLRRNENVDENYCVPSSKTIKSNDGTNTESRIQYFSIPLQEISDYPYLKPPPTMISDKSDIIPNSVMVPRSINNDDLDIITSMNNLGGLNNESRLNQLTWTMNQIFDNHGTTSSQQSDTTNLGRQDAIFFDDGNNTTTTNNNIVIINNITKALEISPITKSELNGNRFGEDEIEFSQEGLNHPMQHL